LAYLPIGGKKPRCWVLHALGRPARLPKGGLGGDETSKRKKRSLQEHAGKKENAISEEASSFRDADKKKTYSSTHTERKKSGLRDLIQGGTTPNKKRAEAIWSKSYGRSEGNSILQFIKTGRRVAKKRQKYGEEKEESRCSKKSVD